MRLRAWLWHKEMDEVSEAGSRKARADTILLSQVLTNRSSVARRWPHERFVTLGSECLVHREAAEQWPWADSPVSSRKRGLYQPMGWRNRVAVRGLRAHKRKQRLYPKLGKRNSDKIRNCCFKNHRNSRINKQILELSLQKEGQAIGGGEGHAKVLQV